MNLGYSQSADQYYDMDTGQPVNLADVEASPMDAFLINAGERFHNLGEKLGLVEPTGVSTENLNAMNPVSSTLGQMAPYLATAPLGGGAAVQAGLGALTGAAFAEPGEEGAEAAFGAAGGAVGDMAGRMLGRLFGMKAMQQPMTKTAQEFADTGGRLTPGQAWDIGPLKDFENWLQARPGGNIAYSDIARANTKNLNKKALEALGIGDRGFKNLGDDAIEAAYDTIGQQFDDVGKSLGRVEIDVDLADDLRTYLGKSGKLKRTMERIGVDNYGEAGEAMAADGRGLMSIRSRLLKQSKGAVGEDAVAYGDLIDDIDNVMQANAPAGLAEQYGLARGRYRALKDLEKSISSEGNILPGRLANRMREWRGAEGAIGDLRTNVRAGTSQALGVPYGNSGTAQRSVPWTDYPMAPVWGGLGLMERSLLQQSTPFSRYGGAAGAGLLAPQDD